MARHVTRRVGDGSLRDAVGPGAEEARVATQVTPAVKTLAVACACGKGTRRFPQADVRAGRCEWSCGRSRCEPST